MGQNSNNQKGDQLPFSAMLPELQKLQDQFTQQYRHILEQQPSTLGTLADPRFRSEAWAQYPQLNYLAHMYKLSSDTMLSMLDAYDIPDDLKEKLNFSMVQWLDAMAPSNFFALNADALKAFNESQGESLQKGFMNFLNDLQKGRISQTDETAFEVGENLACTEGSVVYENHLFQLIQYSPSATSVYSTPLVVVPPCINKYYILDLQQKNSLVKYLVDQGQQVFLISWRNPLPTDSDGILQATWDDYVQDGVLNAFSVVSEITDEKQVNALGFCVGGTMASTAVAVARERGDDPVKSLTLLTTFLNFENSGVMNVFIDEASVRLREQTLGQGGLMTATELATTFSFLRPNELVWNYVVNNYYKGETPSAFDILYWNADSTNLPGPFFTWYLRNTYLENNLVKPNYLKVAGTPVNLQNLDMPMFVYASKEDHIVPWVAAYQSAQELSTDVTFVLGASGHIAGVINPPARNKRQFWTGAKAFDPTLSVNDWFNTAQDHPGSWWDTWAEWLNGQAGDKKRARKTLGNKKYPVLEAAPGSYVKEKAVLS